MSDWKHDQDLAPRGKEKKSADSPAETICLLLHYHTFLSRNKDEIKKAWCITNGFSQLP